MNDASVHILSVIVPTCQRPDMLRQCLERLAPEAQTLDASCYEVIVSDDGIESAEQALGARFPWVRWVTGPRRGPAANRNSGAKHARGDWLAFTDDDCLPSSAWLESYRLAMHDGCRVYEGRTCADGERTRLDMECPANETGGYLWSCNFMIDAYLFRELGGFDEHFPTAAMEDVDLRWRINDRAIEILFVENAVVGHPWRCRKSWRHQRDVALSVSYFVTKHPRSRSLYTTRAILMGLARNLFSHTPAVARKVGLKGLGREVGLLVYRSMAMIRSIQRSRRQENK